MNEGVGVAERKVSDPPCLPLFPLLSPPPLVQQPGTCCPPCPVSVDPSSYPSSRLSSPVVPSLDLRSPPSSFVYFPHTPLPSPPSLLSFPDYRYTHIIPRILHSICCVSSHSSSYCFPVLGLYTMSCRWSNS
eukprot:768092-Hanusia_phi.AAC.3